MTHRSFFVPPEGLLCWLIGCAFAASVPPPGEFCFQFPRLSYSFAPCGLRAESWCLRAPSLQAGQKSLSTGVPSANAHSEAEPALSAPEAPGEAEELLGALLAFASAELRSFLPA